MFGLTAIECFIAIIVVFVISYWITPRKYVWVSFLLTTVLLCVLAYNVSPNPQDDLLRYYKQIDWMRSGGIDRMHEAIKEDQFDWKTFRVTAYICYFVSRLPSNSWLPVITIFIVYGGAFLVIYRAANRFKVSKAYIFIAAMMFLSTYWYYDVYSGTRNGLAFSIAVTAAYFHLFERNFIPLCYIGYLTAAFTHSGGIMPVALALLAAFTFNTSGKFINGALIFGVVAGGALFPYIASVTDSEFFDAVGEKAEHYGQGSFIDLSNETTMYYVNITFAILCLAILIYVSYYFTNSRYASELKRFYKYTSLCLFFAIGCAFTSGLIFVRFTRFILPVVIPILFMIGMTIQREQVTEEGSVKLSYYSNFAESFRYRISMLVWFVVIAYTAIHLWYLINGSSLHWLTFEYWELYE
ncbi:MAG: EpsG family protein [Eubacterium sp.]|nr:EpsG family protein [Eubacterium sp.]